MVLAGGVSGKSGAGVPPAAGRSDGPESAGEPEFLAADRAAPR